MLPLDFVWTSGILYNHGNFDRRKKTTTEESYKTSRYSGIWPCARPPRFEKVGQTNMIQCLQMALYETRKTRTKRKRFYEDSYLPSVSANQPSRLSVTLPIHTYISGNKKKRNRLCFCMLALLSYTVYNTRGTTIIVQGNGHGDPSLHPDCGCLYFTLR